MSLSSYKVTIHIEKEVIADSEEDALQIFWDSIDFLYDAKVEKITN